MTDLKLALLEGLESARRWFYPTRTYLSPLRCFGPVLADGSHACHGTARR